MTIKELQRKANDNQTSVSSLLRDAKIIASRLNQEEFLSWIDKELNGYKEKVPDYRVVKGVPEGFNPYRGWISYVHSDSKSQEIISQRGVSQSMAELEELLKSSESTFEMKYPADMETLNTRCCIAGGGPAGIMLGYLLARAGIDVVVLEKWSDFFRDFRGDTIHPSTMEVLFELGILNDFLKLPHNEMQQMAAHMGGEEVTVADFTKLRTRCPYIAFIPQWDFLNFLSAKAKAFPQFHLMMETEATDLIEEEGRIVGIRAKNKEKEYKIRAEVVIGADGRHSTVREKAHLAVKEFGAPIDVLWFRLTRTDDGTKRSLGYIDAGRGLVLLDRDEYWQCGLIIAKGGFAGIQARGLERLKDDIAVLAPFLSSVVSELQDWNQVKLLSVDVDYLTIWYKKGLLCIGDSAHAMSPVGGVGINLAIQDSVAAANVLVPAFRRGTPTVDDFKKIQKRRSLPTYLTQRLQVFLHHRVLGPVLTKSGHMRLPWFIRMMGRIPLLQRIPAYVIGIGFRPEHVRVTF